MKAVHSILGVALFAGCSGGKYLSDFEAEPTTTDATLHPPEQVTAGNESNFAPDLSPNGAFVAYTSDRKGNKDIWEKQTRGGFGHQLTLHPADDFSPVISPDGDKIAFISRRDDAAGDVHVMEFGFTFKGLIGKSEGSVTPVASKETEDTNPAWFPDSNKLIFAARKPGDALPQLMVADLDDMKPAPLGSLEGDQPRVSPDGHRVAFVKNGALFIYYEEGEKVVQLTEGGVLQDGQPRFTQDGKALTFIRYADDTNGDGKLNGDDRPTAWRLEIEDQQSRKIREGYTLTPLTSARYAVFSPEIRSPFLYVALQNQDGLDIFRYPEFGQVKPAVDLEGVRVQFDQQPEYDDKIYILRRAQTAFTTANQPELAVEAALMELDWAVQNDRRTEAHWVRDKLAQNFADRPDMIALADVSMILLDLSPVAYPLFDDDLNRDQQRLLTNLLGRVETVEKAIPAGDAKGKRVHGRARLARAKILAAQRKFFDANDLLSSIPKDFAGDRPLAAETAYYAAVITPATGGVDAGIRALREVVAKFPENRNIVQLASEEAVRLLEAEEHKVEALVALRTNAKGLPIMPALAHMRIAEFYSDEGKPAVAANEMRQIVDLYPESPEATLDAAEKLSILEEKANRFEAAEKMLLKLNERFQTAKPEHKALAKALLVDFYLRLGENLLKQDEPAMAAKEYEKVIALDPLNVSAHRGRIDSAYKRKNLEPLRDKYEDEADEHPDSAERQYFYGYALTYEIDDETSITSQLGTIEDCIEILENARQLNSQIMHIHQTLGWLYLQKNFWTKKYVRSGAILAKVKNKTGMLADFFGAGDPDWRELSIDSFQNAYFLTKPDTIERVGLAQNLGQGFFSLKNYQKSLSYYMQRVKALPVIPMRDQRAEAILLNRAGRSAYQIDELELAESLMRSALTAWENVGNDERIAFTIDSLALILRERGNYKDAITLYERLEKAQRRLQMTENVIGTLSNLGICHFQENQHDKALTYFDQAEKELKAYLAALIEAGEPTTKPPTDAIKIDVAGGTGSPFAQGFDLSGRQALIHAYRYKIYEKLERHDLMIETQEAKLALLKARREEMIDDEDAEDNVMAEEISVVENNLGELRLAGGQHLKAREAFLAAQATAKLMRPEEQKYMSKGEVLNSVNHARVQLRLATLGLIDQTEIDQTVKDLDATAEELRPVYNEGSKAEARPLAQLLAISSSLKATQGVPGDDQRLKGGLEESLAIMKKFDAPKGWQDGTLLAYQDAVKTEASDAPMTIAVTDFRKKALADPALEWKVLASQGDAVKAFEALDRFVAGGGTLKAPTDRLAAREVFERALAEGAKDDPALILQLRRYLLLHYTDVATRSFGTVAILQKILSIKETPKIQALLGENDVILVAHRTLKGKLILIVIGKSKEMATTTTIGAGDLFNASAYTQVLQSSGAAQALPPGGHLYLVPSAELWDVAWEDVAIEGQKLGQRHVLAFLPAPDVLPDYHARRSLPKSTIGHLPGATPNDEIRAANVGRDYESIPLAEAVPLTARLRSYNLVHIDAPLIVNDVEPGKSVVRTPVPEAAKGATDYVYDLPLKRLVKADYPNMTIAVFANVQRDSLDLSKGSEGHDGWAALSLASAVAGVSTLITVTPQPSVVVNWPAFYQAIDEKSLAEAAKAAAIPGRLIGYAGVTAAEEVAYAKETLGDVIDEADEAKEEKEYDVAARAYKVALYYHKRLQGDPKQEAQLLKSLVDVLFSSLKYEEALHFQKKIVAKLKGEDPIDYAKAVTSAAVAAVSAKKAEEAEALLAEAEKIYAEEDEPSGLGKVYQTRGINLDNQNKYEEAIAAYKKSAEFFAEEEPVESANRILAVGNIYRNKLSKYSEALEYYGQAATQFKQLGKQDSYVPVLIDKANTLIQTGQLEEAIGILEREVVPTIDREKQRVLYVRSSQILANAYFRAGQYQEAKDLNARTLVEAAKIEQKLTQVNLELDAVGLNGLILNRLGQPKAAFKVTRDGITKAKEFNLKGQISLLYNNYGFLARENGAVDQSIEFFNVALKIDEELKSKSAIAYDNRNMGLSIILKGDYNRARELLTDALKTSEELNLVYNAAYCYFGLGDMALREEKWAEAETHFRKALETSEKGYMLDFVWRANGGIAAAKLKQGQVADAEKHYAASVALIEKLRAGLKSEDSRSAFLSDAGVQEIYEAYAAVLMDQNKAEAAWQLSERSRSRAFIDSLGTQKIRFAKAESGELINQEKALKGEVESLEWKGDAVALKDAQGRYAQLIARMNETDAQLAEFVRVDDISKEELQKALPATTALIEYMVTPEKLLIWVIRDGKVDGKAVAVSHKELLGRVKDFRLLMQNYSSPEYLGKELADILLTPVSDSLQGADRLVIVPHGALHFLSFAALPLADGYVIDRYPISYLESATLARYVRAGKGNPTGPDARVLALANPPTPKDMADLPFTGKEVDVMSRYFGKVSSAEGNDASEAAVKRAEDGYDVLHIASHGEFLPSAPAESRLLLAAADGQDGNLSVSEIFGMSTKAKLVTLSACETGLGKISAADEIVGMNRAFFYAGANTVVSSLWRISDVASAVTMKRFYRYLAEGRDKAEALRQAQITARRYFNHPAYWAAFRVLGDDR